VEILQKAYANPLEVYFMEDLVGEEDFQGIDVDMVGLNSALEAGGADPSPGKTGANHFNSADSQGFNTDGAANQDDYFMGYQPSSYLNREGGNRGKGDDDLTGNNSSTRVMSTRLPRADIQSPTKIIKSSSTKIN